MFTVQTDRDEASQPYNLDWKSVGSSNYRQLYLELHKKFQTCLISDLSHSVVDII
jgi:hypothetical protein